MLLRDHDERTTNRLLKGLKRSDYLLLLPHLGRVCLGPGTPLEVANTKINKVHFIECGLATVIGSLGDTDHRAEVGLIGPEGMTGVSVVFGTPNSPHDTIVQIEVGAQVIRVTDLRRVLARSTSLASCLLRFACTLNLQLAHTAVANANGKIEERLARWLLMVHDRVKGSELPITHETIAALLATRRESITVAINKLEAAGAVSTSLGRIRIEDRNTLREAASGLYTPISHEPPA